MKNHLKFLMFFMTIVTLPIISYDLTAYGDETDLLADYIDIDVVDALGNNLNTLKDGTRATNLWFNNETAKITSSDEIHGLYLIWDVYPTGGITITSDAQEINLNTGYFQDYIDLHEFSSSEITISVNGEGKLCDIFAISSGILPENVHNWQSPLEKADILVFPTHADDEHLFMGAVMPMYLDRGDVTIQIAYMVNHSTEPYRQQELLNGLWESGIRNYPIVPEFPDIYSDSLEHAKTVYSEEDVLDYTLGLIDTFKPQVIVGHDIDGEYGHGAHILNAHLLLKAVEVSEEFPKKMYLHLYAENEIVLDVDAILNNYDGRSAFEVAEDAFAHHVSQSTYFQVSKSGFYSLQKYGLAYTTVGVDTGNDMLENIVTYQEQDRIEAEKLAAEKAEQERLEKAEQERLDEEKAEQERLELEKIEKEKQRLQELLNESEDRKTTTIIFAIGMIAISVVFAIFLGGNRKREDDYEDLNNMRK